MQVIKTLNVQATPFYNHILKAVQYELKEHTQKNYELNEIKEGLEYEKVLATKAGTSGKVKVKLLQIDKPTLYQASFTSIQGINTITYRIKPIEDDSIEITYEEEFISSSKLKNLNYKLMSTLYDRKNKRRIHALLNAIEDHLKNQ